MVIHKNLKGLERMEVLITSHMKIFLANRSNSYAHTARNAKVTLGRIGKGRIVHEKTVMKRKVFRGVFRNHLNIYGEAFLRKYLTR